MFTEKTKVDGGHEWNEQNDKIRRLHIFIQLAQMLTAEGSAEFTRKLQNTDNLTLGHTTQRLSFLKYNTTFVRPQTADDVRL